MERFHALIKGGPPGIVCFCDSVAIRLRFHSDSSALLQSVFFTMQVMQISSPLLVNHATQSRSNDCKIQYKRCRLQPFAKHIVAIWLRFESMDNAIWNILVGVAAI